MKVYFCIIPVDEDCWKAEKIEFKGQSCPRALLYHQCKHSLLYTARSPGKRFPIIFFLMTRRCIHKKMMQIQKIRRPENKP
jgi:hypothetical protein